MAHVGVSIDDDTKEQWIDHIEESDYGSMSELIRTAVRKEIRRDDDGDGGSVPRELEKDMDRVAETQTTLQDQMDKLAEQFEEVADTTLQTQYPDEVVQLGHDIAGDLDEIHHDQFGDLEREVMVNELEEIRQSHGDNPSHGMILDALDYLEESLSYIEKRPTPPSEYYRLVGTPSVDRQSEEYRGGD
jgi:Arc/MetJ-type ribon-helix-helix transcriptional regulator